MAMNPSQSQSYGSRLKKLRSQIQEAGSMDLYEDDLREIMKAYGTHMVEMKNFPKALEIFCYQFQSAKKDPSQKDNPFSSFHIDNPVLAVDRSYVVGLLSQHKKVLLEYLFELHKIGMATNDCTEILLKMYLKRATEEEKEKEEIELIKTVDDLQKEFLNKAHSMKSYHKETIIKLLRKYGLRKHALNEAYKFPETAGLILEIEMVDYSAEEDEGRHWHLERSLLFIEKMPENDAFKFMLKYGRELLKYIPKQATNVMIRLCNSVGTGNYKAIPIYNPDRKIMPDSHLASSLTRKSQSGVVQRHRMQKLQFAENVVQMFTCRVMVHSPEHKYWLMVFLESVIFNDDGGFIHFKVEETSEFFTLLMEIYIFFYHLLKDSDCDSDYSKYVNPFSSNEHFSDSIEQQKDLIAIQECMNNILSKSTYDIFPRKEFLGTFSFRSKMSYLIKFGKKARKYYFNFDRIIQIISTNDSYDRDILIEIYRRLKFYHYLIESLKKGKMYRKLLEEGQKYYSDDDQNFWVGLLDYYARHLNKYLKPSYIKTSHEEKRLILRECIQKILEKNTISPVVVVEFLKKYNHISFEFIQDFMIKYLTEIREESEINEKQIILMANQTKELTQKTNDLETNAQVQTFKNCSYCRKRLYFPFNSFLCGHTFHQRCLGSGLVECQICSNEHKEKVKELVALKKRGHSSGKDLSFSVVSSLFGRGIFDN